jgi:sugar transferase (PEP-CTERM/EpsH1 system associated)
MRILFLTSRLPYPPTRGDRVRTYNFLRVLAERHEVHLISFVESDDEIADVRHLPALAAARGVRLSPAASRANLAAHLLSPLPYQVVYYRSSAMRDAVAQALAAGAYDLVYVHLFRMVPFILGRDGRPLPAAAGARTVVDLTDVISFELELSLPRRNVALRPAYWWESRKIRRYEARVAGLFDEAWVISEADRETILGRAPGASVAVVPNGVDERLFDVPDARSRPPVVLFLGNLSIGHNTDAVLALVRDIMPRVRAHVPDASLEVVGDGVSPVLSSLSESEGFRLLGYAPDLAVAYARASVFAAPLRFAAGVQNKLLEAMASGLPVVTSSVGNRGLAAADGVDLLVRDDPASFAGAVVDVLRSPELRTTVGERGRRFVRERFNWRSVLDHAERVARG